MKRLALIMLVLAVMPALGMGQDVKTWAGVKQLAVGQKVKVLVGPDIVITGAFVQASDVALIVRRESSDMTIERVTIRSIEAFSKSRKWHRQLLYGSIGAATGIALGAPVDEYSNNETGDGGLAKPVFGAIGLSIALLGTTRSGYYRVYEAGKSPVQPMSVTESFDDLKRRIGAGDRVSVTGNDGREFEGQVEALSAGSLTLNTGNQRRDLTPGQVKVIRQRLPDSLKNGLLWGSLIGASLGVAGEAAEKATDEYGSGIGGHPSDYIAVVVIGGGIGAGIGAMIDRFHKGQRVIYSQPARPTTSTSVLQSFRIAPLFSKEKKGVSLSLSF